MYLDESQVDFSQVHADDAFLDALGAACPNEDDVADDELAALLLAWRHTIDGEPIHELVDPELAVAAVRLAIAMVEVACLRSKRGA